jgi:cytochrome c biogenesis protein CcmG/thiol:disulfide interchange protein DsbE
MFVALAAMAGAGVAAGLRATVGAGGPGHAGSGRPSLPALQAGYSPTDAEAVPFSLPELVNPHATVSLHQFAGHPLVVNFWASWCPPCRQEMAALASAARREAGRVAFVGIDTNDQRSSAVSFADEAGVTYPIAFDATATVARQERLYGLPVTLFVSATSKVVGRQLGPLTSSRLEQLIGKAFGADAARATAHPG